MNRNKSNKITYDVVQMKLTTPRFYSLLLSQWICEWSKLNWCSILFARKAIFRYDWNTKNMGNWWHFAFWLVRNRDTGVCGDFLYKRHSFKALGTFCVAENPWKLAKQGLESRIFEIQTLWTEMKWGGDLFTAFTAKCWGRMVGFDPGQPIQRQKFIETTIQFDVQKRQCIRSCYGALFYSNKHFGRNTIETWS